MRVQLHILRVLALSLAIFPLRMANAQGNNDLDQWFDSVWARSADPTIVEPLHYKLSIVNEFIPSASELSSLKSRVHGHPQHPDAWKVSVYEHAMKRKPEVTTVEVWFKDGVWRKSQDQTNQPDGKDFFIDMCLRKSSMWSLQKDQLTRASLTGTFPPYADVRKSGGGIARMVAAFPTGGLSLVSLSGLDRPALRVTGDHWIADAKPKNSSGASVHIEGTWNDVDHRGRVTLVQWRGPTAQEDDSSLIAEDWKTVDGRADEMAFTIREVRLDGRPLETHRLLTSESVSSEEIERVTAEPTPHGIDPIRGASTFSSIFDFMQGEGTVRAVDDSGTGQSVPFNGGRSKARVDLQRAGWWAAGTLLAALLVFRLRSYLNTRKSSTPVQH